MTAIKSRSNYVPVFHTTVQQALHHMPYITTYGYKKTRSNKVTATHTVKPVWEHKNRQSEDDKSTSLRPINKPFNQNTGLSSLSIKNLIVVELFITLLYDTI